MTGASTHRRSVSDFSDGMGRRIQLAVVEQRQHFQAALLAEKALVDERWAGWKALDQAAWLLADTRFRSLEAAIRHSAEATDRRLDKLDAERQASNATAAQARIQAEIAAANSRRNMMLAIFSAAVSGGLSLLLHFLGSSAIH